MGAEGQLLSSLFVHKLENSHFEENKAYLFIYSSQILLPCMNHLSISAKIGGLEHLRANILDNPGDAPSQVAHAGSIQCLIRAQGIFSIDISGRQTES